MSSPSSRSFNVRRKRPASSEGRPVTAPKPMALVPLSLVIADFEGGERPKKAFRQRAITWAMWVAARFAREGLELEVHPGDADGVSGTEIAFHPRAGRGNTAKGRGASLLFSIDRVEVEVCLELRQATTAITTLRGFFSVDPGGELAPLDAQRLDGGSLAELDVLMDILARLPEQFEVRAAPGSTVDSRESETETETESESETETETERMTTFVAGIDCETLRALVDLVEAEGGSLRIGWRLPREVALEHATLLDEQLADALLALAPLFRLLGGSRAKMPRNQAPRVDSAQLKRSGRSSIPELKARGSLHPVRPSIDPRERIALAIAAAKARTGTAPALRVSGRTASFARAPRIMIPSTLGTSRTAHAAARGTEILIRGSRVRVLSGPFEGKEGVVQELDGKGGARVLLGLLATRLELVDLQPASRGAPGTTLSRGDRPALGTSHRRS